jgi:hypothetical protein
MIATKGRARGPRVIGSYKVCPGSGKRSVRAPKDSLMAACPECLRVVPGLIGQPVYRHSPAKPESAGGKTFKKHLTMVCVEALRNDLAQPHGRELAGGVVEVTTPEPTVISVRVSGSGGGPNYYEVRIREIKGQ